MNKIAILIFALAISHTLGQACDQTVRTYLGTAAVQTTLQTSLTNPASCKHFTGTQTCCPSTYFDTFTTDKNTLQTTLEGLAKTRDEHILNARKLVAAQAENYGKFKAAAAAAKNTLTTWATTAPDNTITTTQVGNVNTDITKMTTLFDDFFNKYNDYYNGFNTYRKARATCFTEILKTVVSSWCLGCVAIANYNTYGIVVDGTPAVTNIALGATAAGRLALNCQPYFVASDQQSNILVVHQYAAGLAAKTTALLKVAASPAVSSGVTDYLAVTKTALLAAPSTIENACTTTTCAWLTTNVFVKGKLDNAKLILGGADDSANVRRRMLADERQLQTGNSFEPATDEAKISISFPEVVGGLSNTRELSALRVGVFSCIVAFFVALLI